MGLNRLDFAIIAAYLVGKQHTVEGPQFERLTFQRGYIRGARFSADGKDVVYSALWEGRRKLYELGARTPERVPARVVSIGNLTVGGAGKTTLVLHLASLARARGEAVAVVARRYRPGPAGLGGATSCSANRRQPCVPSKRSSAIAAFG